MTIEDTYEHTQLMRASLDHCVKCTICETQCPVSAVTPLFPGPKFVGPQAERYRLGKSVDHSVDYCSSCGTCTLVCPQGVHIAELNSQARAAMKQQNNMPLRDQLISRTTFMGKVMTPVAPVANWALGAKPIRVLVEKVIGIGRNAGMPTAHTQTLTGWNKKRTKNPKAGTRGKVVYFHGCAAQYFEVETGQKTIEVLEHLGYEVIVPKQGCCGLALQSNGLFDAARQYVRKMVADLRSGGLEIPIVASSTSCGSMLKREAIEILGVEDPELADVSSRMVDIMELLRDLHDAGELPTDFKRMDLVIPYHPQCQLRSHGIGIPALEVLRLIPGVTVKESGVTCCGIAGTYGLKKEKYDIAQAVGKPLFDMIKETNKDLAVCDNDPCRWQIQAATGARTVHAITIIHEAYGLS